MRDFRDVNFTLQSVMNHFMTVWTVQLGKDFVTNGVNIFAARSIDYCKLMAMSPDEMIKELIPARIEKSKHIVQKTLRVRGRRYCSTLPTKQKRNR